MVAPLRAFSTSLVRHTTHTAHASLLPPCASSYSFSCASAWSDVGLMWQVYEASTGRLNEAHLNDPVLLWLVMHLCLGDTWNTMNNAEGRTGAAVPAVAVVWLSAVFAAKQSCSMLKVPLSAEPATSTSAAKTEAPGCSMDPRGARSRSYQREAVPPPWGRAKGTVRCVRRC